MLLTFNTLETGIKNENKHDEVQEAFMEWDTSNCSCKTEITLLCWLCPRVHPVPNQGLMQIHAVFACTGNSTAENKINACS
jgi:hypothetical protein